MEVGEWELCDEFFLWLSPSVLFVDAGMTKIIFKKPFVVGEGKGKRNFRQPPYDPRVCIFKILFIFVCKYLFKARELSFYKYVTGNLYLPSFLCSYSWALFLIWEFISLLIVSWVKGTSYWIKGEGIRNTLQKFCSVRQHFIFLPQPYEDISLPLLLTKL